MRTMKCSRGYVAYTIPTIFVFSCPYSAVHNREEQGYPKVLGWSLCVRKNICCSGWINSVIFELIFLVSPPPIFLYWWILYQFLLNILFSLEYYILVLSKLCSITQCERISLQCHWTNCLVLGFCTLLRQISDVASCREEELVNTLTPCWCFHTSTDELVKFGDIYSARVNQQSWCQWDGRPWDRVHHFLRSICSLNYTSGVHSPLLCCSHRRVEEMKTKSAPHSLSGYFQIQEFRIERCAIW